MSVQGFFRCPFCREEFSTRIGRAIHVRKNHKNGKGGKVTGPIKKPKK